jgi:hypothetical protein
MQRKKSLLAATIISATLLTGAVAYAASSGVLEGRDDNVGNLQPTTTRSSEITVFVDPVTGLVTATTPQPAAGATAPTTTRQPSADVTTTRSTTSTIDDHGGDRDDDDDNSGPGSDDSDSGSDDREHGRDSDDD